MIEHHVSEVAAHAILEQADYLRQSAGESFAAKWELAVDQSFRMLLSFPEMGSPCRFRSSALDGLRWIFVKEFPKYLIFYRFSRDERSIRIVHVIHSSRDLETILSESE